MLLSDVRLSGDVADVRNLYHETSYRETLSFIRTRRLNNTYVEISLQLRTPPTDDQLRKKHSIIIDQLASRHETYHLGRIFVALEMPHETLTGMGIVQNMDTSGRFTYVFALHTAERYARAAVINKPSAVALATLVASSINARPLLQIIEDRNLQAGVAVHDYPTAEDLYILTGFNIPTNEREEFIKICLDITNSTTDAVMMMVLIGHGDSEVVQESDDHYGASVAFVRRLRELMIEEGYEALCPEDIEQYVVNGAKTPDEVIGFIKYGISPEFVSMPV